MKDIAIRDGFVGEKYTTEVLLENNNTIPITVIVKIDVQLCRGGEVRVTSSKIFKGYQFLDIVPEPIMDVASNRKLCFGLL